MRHVRLITGLFVFMLLAISTAALANGPHKVIAGAELEAMMKDGKQITIVDVREPGLFAKGHIPGAVNIPYDGAHNRILKELSPKDRIVFVCHGGPMGDELGEILAKNGYNQVYNLKGGMRYWKGPVTQ